MIGSRNPLASPHPNYNSTISPRADDLVWQTYPQCPANNTYVLRDSLTAVTNVGIRFM